MPLINFVAIVILFNRRLTPSLPRVIALPCFSVFQGKFTHPLKLHFKWVVNVGLTTHLKRKKNVIQYLSRQNLHEISHGQLVKQALRQLVKGEWIDILQCIWILPLMNNPCRHTEFSDWWMWKYTDLKFVLKFWWRKCHEHGLSKGIHISEKHDECYSSKGIERIYFSNSDKILVAINVKSVDFFCQHDVQALTV